MRPGPQEIQQLAGATGKLLEVACAREFLKFGRGWQVRLGSYYEDGEGPPREFDVLATREERFMRRERGEVVFRVRALISCRGFPDDAYPLTYSVAPASPLVLDARLPMIIRGAAEAAPQRLGKEMAVSWLTHTKTIGERPIVALDVLLPNNDYDKQLAAYQNQLQKQQAKPITPPPLLTPPSTHKLKGDKRIFTAIDSAVKAAVYWSRVDHQSREYAVATLAVPTCVFSTEFSDIDIDGGNLALPELRTRAYMTSGYPSNHPHLLSHTNITTLVVSETEIAAVIAALETLFIEFRDAADAQIL